ncbi:MAG: VCBS repeat-containing protein [Pirellulales bacterium]
MKVPLSITASVLLLVGLLCVSPVVADDQGPVRFDRRELLLSPNEGCALADVDRDGRLDIIAGTHWFAAPDFTPRPIREIAEFSEDFLANNGDHPYDVNGDGWIDVVSGEWMGDEIHWYENPGPEWLAKGLRWKPHLLKKTRGENEALFLRDLDGDGVPEIVVDCWEDDAPLVCWKFATDADGEPTIERIELGSEGCGHGMAFGDVNGDGREDILVKVGWYERPEGDPLANKWKLHRDWDRGHGSTPHLVVDLNGDGRNDVIWGNGHDFGLYWYEQGKPTADGATTWTEHLIDNDYSQTHTLVWVDIDGDDEPELITGKRVRGHAGRDPGGHDPECLYYYEWHPNDQTFTRHEISPPGGGTGTGMQINTADLNGDGLVDIAVGGKSGTWLLLNRGR